MLSLLEFEVDATRYAVPVERVVEVIPRVWLTPLPGADAVVLGVFDLRGEVTVAVDLRSRLGHAGRAPSVDDQLVVVRGARRVLALVVDRVRDLLAVAPERVQRPSVPSPHVRGVVPLADGLLLLEDLDAVLSIEEETTLDRALRAPGP